MIKTRSLLTLGCTLLCLVTAAQAQSRRKSPTSKLYVADMVGDVQIDTGSEIDDLTKKSVFNAEGTTIETRSTSNASVVLSNGTGIYFDVNTHVQIRKFEQESFRSTRTDLEDEPSLSVTDLYIVHGVAGISVSKLVAGSTLTCETSLAIAAIHGRQVVVHALDTLTVISMVEGEATVQAGALGVTHLVRNHQQIIIRPGKESDVNLAEIRDIPEGNEEDADQWLEERLLAADGARKLVYFEVQGRRGADNGDIKLFEGGDGPGGTADNGIAQIVAVPVVPATTTVQPNVSPANLISR